MGLSRALLGGVATGFMKANNDRSDRMAQRMQELAENTAMMARERAKTQHSVAQESARVENEKKTSLRAEGAIDNKGNYKDSWWLRQSQADWNTYGKPSGMTHEEYTNTVFKAGKPTKFVSQYKSAHEIDQSSNALHSSISSNLRNDLNKPAATALEKFLGGSLRKMTGTPQEAVAPPSAPLPSIDPMAPQGGPQETYGGTGAIPEAPLAASTAPKRSSLTTVNLYSGENIDGKTYQYDPSTGEVLDENSGQWHQVPEGMSTISANRNPFTRKFTDESTGEELSQNVIETYASDPKATDRVAGKTYIAIGTVRSGDVSLSPAKKGEFKQQTNNAVRFATVDKVSNLAIEMLSQDYVDNPATWVASRLATIADALGATINLTGKTLEDTQAITSFIEGRLENDWEAIKDIGPLDAAAISSGNVKSIQTLLTYATTSMLTKDGRITMAARTDAKEIAESLVTGGAVHTGKLVSLLNQNSKEMSSIVDSDLNIAMANMRSPTWERYSDVKRMVQGGWKPLYNTYEGDQIKMNLGKLENSDPVAYRKSLASLAQTPFDIDSLDEKTIYYNNKYKKNIMLYSTLTKDGSYAFSANRVQ